MPEARQFSDGEIFLRVRHYQKIDDSDSENEWLARLTEGKIKNLKRLLRNPVLLAALDRLLVFPGLWSDVQFGSFRQLLSLHCDKVSVHSINKMHFLTKMYRS